MPKKLLYIFILIPLSIYSQKQASIFKGKTIDSTTVVKDVHIINLNTKAGTFSLENGKFQIKAKVNDTLQLSSIGYQTKKMIVKAYHFIEKENLIEVKEAIYNLDEIVYKRTNLTGFLAADIKQTPKKNYKEKAVADLLIGIKNLDLKEIANMKVGLSEAHLIKPTKLRLPNTFEGVGFSFGVGNSNKKKKKKNFSDVLDEEDKIVKKIYNLLGEDFFKNDLNIKKEQHTLFINYCLNKNIIQLYKDKKMLKLITILKIESLEFLKH